MINRRFLNYKHYQSFLDDLNNGQILRDAIVFIQDESHPCIWTHGKEYLCKSEDEYKYVVLTQDQYDLMLIHDENTIYFTYESDDQDSDWHFGDSFPIILT